MERGVFDIEAVQKANTSLIATIEARQSPTKAKPAAPMPRSSWSRWNSADLRDTLASARARTTGSAADLGASTRE